MPDAATSPREHADIQTLLHDLTREHGVQGAALAILRGDEILEVATGTAHARSGAPVTPQHLFLVGSTTKVFTATLVMQLVDEGRVDLSAPVRRYIPDLQLHDRLATETITVRQLLSHTSGLDNGPYSDHGRDANAVGRYVTSLAEVPLIDRPGKRFSYSNAGLVVAGRLVEKVTGQPWDVALQQRILDPAGLTQSATLPERAILHPVAAPHLQDEQGVWQVAGQWGVSGRAMGPTGSTLACTAGDLARFAAIHVHGGQALNGARILSAESVAAMQRPQVTLPPEMSMTRNWCLGWFADQWNGRTVLGHTGHNVGTGSFLRAIPQEQAAIALTFNSGNDAPLYHYLFQRLLRDLFGIEKPNPWAPIERHQRLDLSAYAGTYSRHDFRVRLEQRDHTLEVTLSQGAQGFPLGQRYYPANRFAFGTGLGDAYQVTPPDGCLSPSIVFDGFIDGQPTHLYNVVFAAQRESEMKPQ